MLWKRHFPVEIQDLTWKSLWRLCDVVSAMWTPFVCLILVVHPLRSVFKVKFEHAFFGGQNWRLENVSKTQQNVLLTCYYDSNITSTYLLTYNSFYHVNDTGPVNLTVKTNHVSNNYSPSWLELLYISFIYYIYYYQLFCICDLLQEKGPSSFAFPTAFRYFQLSLTAFQKFDTKISY